VRHELVRLASLTVDQHNSKVIDFAAVVSRIFPPTSFTIGPDTTTGSLVKVALVQAKGADDDGVVSVTFNIFEPLQVPPALSIGSVVVIRGAKVGVFQGHVVLNALRTTAYATDVAHPDFDRHRTWVAQSKHLVTPEIYLSGAPIPHFSVECIADIFSVSLPPFTVDVGGILMESGLETRVSVNGAPTIKTTYLLGDTTGDVDITTWRDSKIPAAVGDYVFLRNVKVAKPAARFTRFDLAMTPTSVVSVNPEELPDAKPLREWFAKNYPADVKGVPALVEASSPAADVPTQ
jgi:hypothetical protein